ncbi:MULTISPECIES: hypothetical protein [Bacteroides]|uniref:hypothetical protein n=1 Tax=Bacteroides TaxID=816 RepID=UPI00319D8E6C
MKNKVYSIENQDGLNFSVQKTSPCAITHKGKEKLPEQITFLFEGIDPESDLKGDNDLVCSITKEEAVKLAIRLLKLSAERVPEHGLLLDNYSGHDFSVHHAIEDEVHINEPIFEIEDMKAEDIAEDGTISVCLTNESAKELIKVLAKIL